jgi:hypothetical protein
VASRKEQKEQLRREREEREATARAAARRKRLVGYAAGAAVVILALAVAGFVLLSGDDGEGGGGTASADVLPDGGEVPAQEITDLGEAASAASCEQESSKADSREHISDIGETVEYSSDPPTSGRHFESPEQDGAFEEAPDTKLLVHTLEHGRVIIWFKPTLPEQERANLKALFDEDSYQMVLVPNDTMPYEVAATAWNREPEPNGTGRLLGCDTYSDMVFDALRAFKDEHRSNGPEAIP